MKKSKNNAALPAAVTAESRRNWSSATYDFQEVKVNGRFEPKSKKPSVTVPDQSYSIAELFKRSQSGLTVLGREAVYTDDDLPPFERMDFAERCAFLEDLKLHRAAIEAQFKAQDLEAKRIANETAKEEALRKEAELQALIQKEVKDGR